MTAGTERQQRVAASFTRQYYTLMVQRPEKLPSFYTQNASFNHMGHKATDIVEIEAAVSRLYSTQADASVKIQSLSTLTDEEGHIHVTIKGSITTPSGVSQDFTHEVELMEHASHPGSFGIVADRRENIISEEAPRRWALETPPMFAKEPAHNTMEQIEQPASTTVVAHVENPTTKKDVEKLEKPVPVVSAAAATSVPAAGTATVSTTSQPEPSKDVEKPTDTADQSSPATTTEVRRPKSFAEAIMMSKRAGPSQGHTTLLTVLAKESKEHPTVTPTREKKEAAAHTGEKNGTKTVYKNGVNAKKVAGTSTPSNGGKGGKIMAAGGKSKENGNEVNTKRKDSDARALSRFVVFYDIIVKGLPTDATEQTVRDIVEPIAPAKLVKVLSRNDKKDPSVMRTFAFVQLDHDAIKEAGDDVKAMVAKVLAANKGKKSVDGHRIHLDEVREKYTAASNDAAVDVSA